MTHWKRDVLDELYTHADRYLSSRHGLETAQASTIKDRILSLATGLPLTGFCPSFSTACPSVIYLPMICARSSLTPSSLSIHAENAPASELAPNVNSTPSSGWSLMTNPDCWH